MLELSAVKVPAQKAGRRMTFVSGVVTLMLCFSLPVSAAKKDATTTTKTPYSYYVTGNPNATVTAPSSHTSASLVLMGGGPDVDSAFQWMIERAGITPKTGGRFVVIRATGTEAYNPYIFYSDESGSTSTNIQPQWVGGASKGLTSVETLVIPSLEAANHDDVSNILAKANAVFIAGGDQSDYIKYWKNTQLHRTLQLLSDRNIPIGGTSAGLAVLGHFDFSALNGTVTSTQALSDPYNRYMTLDPNPLSLTGGFLSPPALHHTILDSHLDTRDRMGRLITFAGRLVQPGTANTGCSGGILDAGDAKPGTARGIGISVETALLVRGDEKSGAYLARHATNPYATTKPAAYFVRPSVAPSTCAAKKPFTVYTVEIKKLAVPGSDFNLSTWSYVDSNVSDTKHVDVISGQLSSSPY